MTWQDWFYIAGAIGSVICAVIACASAYKAFGYASKLKGKSAVADIEKAAAECRLLQAVAAKYGPGMGGRLEGVNHKDDAAKSQVHVEAILDSLATVDVDDELSRLLNDIQARVSDLSRAARREEVARNGRNLYDTVGTANRLIIKLRNEVMFG